MAKGNRQAAGRTVLSLILVGVFLGAFANVSHGQEVTEGPFLEVIPGKHLEKTQTPGKVSPLLGSVLSKIEARGITMKNAREQGVSALSTPLVKVDEDGYLHTYIHVASLGQAGKAALARYGARIEIANEELGIVQAWDPFDRIDVWNSVALWIASPLPDARGWFGRCPQRSRAPIGHLEHGRRV